MKTKQQLRKIYIHKWKEYLITSKPIEKTGQYCGICCKPQPFKNWNCRICDSHSLAGDPFDDELENFDEEFESLQETVLELKCITRRGNYIYSYSPI